MSKLTLFDSSIPDSGRVLVVDDDRADFVLTQESFAKSFLENEVLWLDSGKKLISYLLKKDGFEESGHPNPLLIFLDLNMPMYSGRETLEKLNALGLLPSLRIVLLTSADEEHVKNLGLGEMPYIPKPLDYEKMYDYIMSTNHYLFE